MKVDLYKTNGSSPPCIPTVDVVAQTAAQAPTAHDIVAVALEEPAIREAIQRGTRKAQVRKYSASPQTYRGYVENTSDFVQATCVALLENHAEEWCQSHWNTKNKTLIEYAGGIRVRTHT